EYAKRVIESTRRVNELEESLKINETELTKLNEKLIATENEKENEFAELSSSLALKENELTEAIESRNEAEKNLAEMKAEYEKAKNMTTVSASLRETELTTQLTAIKAELEKEKKGRQEYAKRATKETEDLRSKLEVAAMKVAEASTKQATAEKECEELSIALALKENEMEELKGRLNVAQSEAEKESEELTATLALKENEVEELKEKLNAAQTEAEKENEELASELALKEGELEKLNEKLKSIQTEAEKENEELASALALKENELSEAIAAQKEAEKTLEEAKLLSRNLEVAVEEAKKTLAITVAEVSQSSNSGQQIIATLQTELAMAQEEAHQNEVRQTELTALNAALLASFNEVTTWKETAENALKRTGDMEKEVSTLKKALEEAEADSEELAGQLAMKEEELAQVEDAKKEAELSVEELTSALALKESEITAEAEASTSLRETELTTQLTAIKAELEKEKKGRQEYAKRATKETEDLRSKLEVAAMKVAEASTKQATAENELAALEKKAKETELGLHAQINVLERSQAELRSLRVDYASLKTRYEEALTESVQQNQKLAVMEVRTNDEDKEQKQIQIEPSPPIESQITENTTVEEEEKKEPLALVKPITLHEQLEQLLSSLQQYEQSSISSTQAMYDQSMAAAVSTVLKINLRNIEQQIRPGQWVPDSEAPRCTYCNDKFTFVRRRHHCRFCGYVFCSSCCNHYMTISSMGDDQRLCHACYLFFVKLQETQKRVAGLIEG
ncbi:hypothetical protein JH06_3735, partial [Blastocystis sp. subtype 4]|uniref:hypothetical protein n=1 Tax=Blastocystis sp. subtype 4 TaxID=944170 RepID=UPI000711F0DE